MPPVPRSISTNWILYYADNIEKFSEAPAAYNVWSAISVISAALKKQVWVDRGTFKVYPNQYIVLVGPPGVGKGTAIHPAHDFLRNHKPPLANYISDRVTAPRIIELLSKGFDGPPNMVSGVPIAVKEASAVLMASELATLLSSSDWMLSFLCDAWDRNEFDYDTRNKGTLPVKNMCVSLMGACVPEFIRRLNKDATAAINGGFTARTIFVFASDKSKSLPWPMSFNSSAEGIAAAANLSIDLAAISRLKGEFSCTPDARIIWERAYADIQPKDDDSDVVRAFKARQGTHIWKVAMCFSAATDDSLLISGYHMKVAIKLIADVLNTLDITFRGVGESPLAEAIAKVQLYLERKGIATRSSILKDCYRHVTSEDLDRILHVLLSIQFCDQYTQGGRSYYRHLKPNQGVTP